MYPKYMPEIETLSSKKTSGTDTNKEWKEESSEVFHYYEYLRKNFRDLNAAIVQRIFGTYMDPDDQRVVEIGGGGGELARLVSPEVKSKMVSSDLNPKFANLIKKKHPELPVVAAEAERLPFESGSVDIIAGYSVFDILPSLENAARETERALRIGGKFIHFMDMANDHFYQNDLLSEDTLVFLNPMNTRQYRERWNPMTHFPFATASKKEVEEILERNDHNKWPFSAIAQYIKKPELEYQIMIKDRRRSVLSDMTRCLNERGINLIPLDYSAMFQQRAQEIFERNGFTVLKNGLESEQEIIKQTRSLFKCNNFLQNRVELKTAGKLADVPNGMLKLESILHVFVAEKKDIPSRL